MNETIELLAKHMRDSCYAMNRCEECTPDNLNCWITPAESLLLLCYPCPECDGNGEIQDRLAWDIPNAKEDCPVCNGTGQGERILAVLAEDQELPECINGGNPIYLKTDPVWYYKQAQQTMISQGWKKTVEEK